jgi:Mannosyl-glycoprotein endo-beta-N-acetylglucosaminidase
MKDFQVTLPVIRLKNNPVRFGFRNEFAYFEANNGQFVFIMGKKPLMVMIALLTALLLVISGVRFPIFSSQENEVAPAYQLEQASFEFPFDDPEAEAIFSTDGTEGVRESFLKKREKLIFYYKTKASVGRLDQLDEATLLELNHQITQLFVLEVLNNMDVEPHVYHFFTNDKDLNKLETALMEQVKFNVPASVKLAQAAVETSYGRHVVNNNYFGIKDKSGKAAPSITTEYFNEAELKANKHIVLSSKKITKNGQIFYKCVVKDRFQEYESPWASFRAHSMFLVNNNRYAPLFTGGKKYQAWADKIGSSKHGGVGYATSPIYGNILKGVIRNYNLDLLDF